MTSEWAYDSRTLPCLRYFAGALFVLGVAALPPAHAQTSASPGTATRQVSNVIGQVYAPLGGPVQQVLRLEFRGDDAYRPPEFVFTDSNGRFVLLAVVQDVSYTITVESDGQNWDKTSTRFIPSGRRPTVQVYLRALEKRHGVPGLAISATELSQEVPRAARKDFDAALELMTQGQTEQARVLLESALKTFPDFVEAHNELAVVLMRAGDLVGAEAHLRRAVEVDSAASRPLLNLGLCLHRQQRFADSLPFLKKAVQLQPSHPTAHLLYGTALMKTRALDLAEPTLLRAYELGGARVARAQYYLSWIYTQRKDYTRAVTALEVFLRDAPNDPEAGSLEKTLIRLRAANAPEKQP